MFESLMLSIALVAAAVLVTSPASAAEGGAAVTRAEAKDLKTHSEAEYAARRKIAEANEALNRADCKTALEGSAKRACERSAKAAAKSAKADAKTVHEAEEQAIRDAKKK